MPCFIQEEVPSGTFVRIFRRMKIRIEIGDLVTFKGKGFGLGKVTSITPQRKGTKDLYHVELLGEDILIATNSDHIEKISPEDDSLVRALDSIGNL